MFEIGFSELVLVMIVGLVVLGPERLPVAVKTVAGWIRAMRSLASTVQNELTQELKLQELQDSIKKVEQNTLQNLDPGLKASMDELRAAAQAMQKSYQEPISLDSPSTAEISGQASSQPQSQSHSEPDSESVNPVTDGKASEQPESVEKAPQSGSKA